MLEIASVVKNIYPKAKFGSMIVSGIPSITERSIMNHTVDTEIEQIKLKHSNYQRQTALTTEPLCHYATYFRRHKKSYPVLGQLESVLLKGKNIPPVGVPIEAMFLAEIKNLLLTAGHDLDLIKGTRTIHVATECINYTGLSGKEQQLVNHDLYLSDEVGVLSSVLNGPDERTKITESTRNACYFVYGVEGVTESLIQEHLKTIFTYLSQAAQGVKLLSTEIV